MHQAIEQDLNGLDKSSNTLSISDTLYVIRIPITDIILEEIIEESSHRIEIKF